MFLFVVALRGYFMIGSCHKWILIGFSCVVLRLSFTGDSLDQSWRPIKFVGAIGLLQKD